MTRPVRFDQRLLELNRYPLRRQLETIFADMDVQGHVNNIAILRFLEEGRSTLLRHAAQQVPTGFGSLVLAHIEVHHLREVTYPGAVEVGIGVGRVGTTSYECAAAVFQDGQCAAVSRATDARRNAGRTAKQEWSDQERAALDGLVVVLD